MQVLQHKDKKEAGRFRPALVFTIEDAETIVLN